MLKNKTPWRVTSWTHVMRAEDIPKGYKGATEYQRPVIVDASGCFVAEFGVGFGFAHANDVAREIVRLVNAKWKVSDTRSS